MQISAGCEALDGEDVAAVGLHGEHGAGLHSLAVHRDGTGAANGGLAADVGAGQAHDFAEVMDEEQAWLNLVLVSLPVDSDTDLLLHDENSLTMVIENGRKCKRP